MANSSGPSSDGSTSSDDDDAVLRAKYLDYCSAQLADVVLNLSPDQIYTVAEKAARERGEAFAGSYMQMVQVATEWLSGQVTLPPFEEWVEAYRRDPEQYESYLIGLWTDELDSTTEN